MARKHPFEEFIERMTEQFEQPTEWPVEMGMRGDPPVDVLDVGDAFEVRVDLPGFDKDDVELTLRESALHLRAERERDDVDARYVRRERSDGSVDRTVTLPEDVDQDAVDATLADGVLTVTLGKASTHEDATSIDIE